MKPRLWNLKSKWIQEMKDKNRDDVEIYYYFENICELAFWFCYLIFFVIALIQCLGSLRDTKKLYSIVRGDIVTLKETCYGMKFPYIWMRERSLLILAVKSCLIKTTFCS